MVKMIPLIKIQEKIIKKIQKKIMWLHAQNAHGIRYGDSSEKWICCDRCGMWFNKKCTGIKRRVPKVFYCERCAV